MKKMINLTKKRKNGIIKKIKIREIGDQFPKYDKDVFTISIESCSNTPEYDGETGNCKIKWLKVPKRCCKWNIPTSWTAMKKNKHYKYWFIGDADYEVIFLD